MKTSQHTFSNLGPAPYTFTGLTTEDDRDALNSWLSDRGHTYTTNLCGGTCDLCGTAISNVYHFRNSDAGAFVVGCDCAELIGLSDEQLAIFIEARKATRRYSAKRQQREDGQARDKAEEDRQAAEARAKTTAGIYESDPSLECEIDELVENGNDYQTRVAGEFRSRIESGRPLTSGQRAFLTRMHGEALTADAGHIGEVGKWLEAEATVELAKEIETQYGLTTIYRLRLDSGHVLVCFNSGNYWIDNTCISDNSDHKYINQGDRIVVRGKVKKHDTRDGRSQTIISHAKAKSRSFRAERAAY